jgi:hypothetical protein
MTKTHSRHINGVVTRLTRQMSLVEQELLTLQKHGMTWFTITGMSMLQKTVKTLVISDEQGQGRF